MMMHATDRFAVLSIGRVYCDLIFIGLGHLPVLGREIFADHMEIAAGGGAFIAAAHLAHAKRKVALVARLGKDALSASVGEQVRDSGVDLRFIERAEDAGPQVTVAAVVDHERAFLTRRAGPVRPTTLEEALAWKDARHLHIAEYATLHEIPDLIARAREHGLTISLDPSWDAALIYDRGLLRACEGIDLFLPNLEEAEAITGHADPEAAIRHLSAAFPTVALKGGVQGAWMISHGRMLHAAAEIVPVVDTTGAGDAFNAGFIDAWLSGLDDRACLKAGIRFGSLSVQAPGGAKLISAKT